MDRISLLDRLTESLANDLAIVGVNQFNEMIVSAAKRSRPNPEQGVRMLIPIDPLGLDVPIPCAGARSFESKA